MRIVAIRSIVPLPQRLTSVQLYVCLGGRTAKQHLSPRNARVPRGKIHRERFRSKFDFSALGTSAMTLTRFVSREREKKRENILDILDYIPDLPRRTGLNSKHLLRSEQIEIRLAADPLSPVSNTYLNA